MLIDNGNIIVEEHGLVEIFNDHYNKYNQKSSDKKPRNYVSDTYLLVDECSLTKVQLYSTHSSIIKVKKKFGNSQTKFQFKCDHS